MPFDVVAIPHAAYAALPNAQSRWLLLCLSRYADRDGRCWPSMRQLARDARMSKSSVQRYLADLSRLGVFSRSRRPGGRYRYEIDASYFRQSCRASPEKAVIRAGVPHEEKAVPQTWQQKAGPFKHQEIPDDSVKKGDSHSVRGITQKPAAHYPHQASYQQKGEGKPGQYCEYSHDDSSRWDARLRGWQKRRMWLDFWGPRPDQPGCWAPAASISSMIARAAATGSAAA